MHVYFPTGYFSGLCFSFSSWDKPWRKDWKLEPSEKTQEKISKIKMKASLSSCQNTREIWESQKKKKERKKKKPYETFKMKGDLCRYYVEQRDPGHGGRPFCPPFLVGKTPASMTLSEFQRADSNSVNQRRGSRETTWSSIKGTREAHQN